MYSEALQHGHSVIGGVCFRGFKIVNDEGKLSLHSLRDPYQGPPSASEVKVLEEMGFIAGATHLLVESYNDKIESNQFKLKEKQSELKKTRNSRKKQEHKNSISKIKGEIEYYKSQVGRWRQND